MSSYWLLKTEPGEYSFDDLVRDKITVWDGVTAPLALKNMARMKKGHEVFIYHSGKERSIVGTARVVRTTNPDPSEKVPRSLVVEIEAMDTLNNPVSLKALKDGGFSPQWDLLRLPRLSVVPVSRQQWFKILSLAKEKRP